MPKKQLDTPVVFAPPELAPKKELEPPVVLATPELAPKNELLLAIVLALPEFLPKKELPIPVVLDSPEAEPKKELEAPVVFVLPAINPTKVLVFILLILILLVAVPPLLLNVTDALDAEINLIDKTIVPLKSLVGVITSVPVVVALGPTLPVAVNEADIKPPKSIVNEPAVLPVTV